MPYEHRNINGDHIARGDLFVIPLDDDEVLVPGDWHEAFVSKTIGVQELNATVSVVSLLDNRDYLPVKVISVTEDVVKVALPVGNDGAQSWDVPIDAFRDVALVREEQRNAV